ncbi:hypothetical protein BAY60_28695 [Prauserella muralis]|uniref:CBS domain-containing protein n=2 Tax=Prauserella muralis TaxID=588067 RepID=A0A2V4AJ08_9PSEU|nr:hypothetical protein BAY60_28695 [Prauserella muralis]
MTRRVVAVGLDTPFRDIVHALVEHTLTAVPVIDPASRPVGIVTVADAAAKREFHGASDLPPVFGVPRRWSRRRKARALTAADLMTAPAPTVTASAPVHAALRRMAHRHTQLCVIDERGHLVGVFAHRDALRCYLRPDAEIHSELEERLPGDIAVHVSDGAVVLSGTVQLHSHIGKVLRDAWRVPGVVAVDHHLEYRIEDLPAHGL